jgi:hypothetical protein
LLSPWQLQLTGHEELTGKIILRQGAATRRNRLAQDLRNTTCEF